jgi:hypothetical protein
VSRKLHPVSRGRFMLLNKLESGFLLFQTQQGLVAVEPSFWQRVYLLWTFRNFRQLSLPLLNPRQTALINSLFRQHAAVVPHEYEFSRWQKQYGPRGLVFARFRMHPQQLLTASFGSQLLQAAWSILMAGAGTGRSDRLDTRMK